MNVYERQSPQFRMSRREEDSMERRFDALREAETLIDLVAAEFNSDPMSVQCFDLRTVARVKACAKALRDNPDPWGKEQTP